MEDAERDTESREHIDVEDAYELRYWTKQLVVTEQQLRSAVQRVGPKVTDVRRALARGDVPSAPEGPKPGP